MLLALLAAMVSAGVIVGCGGSGDEGPTLTPMAPTPSATHTVTPSATEAPSSSLASALLSTGDLSVGWQPGVAGDTFSPETTFCGLALGADLDPLESASAAFSNTRNGLVLAQYLLRYEPGEAEQAVAQYRQTVAPCEEWSVSGGDTEATYRVSELPLTNFGDETFAFSLALDVDIETSDGERMVTLRMHIILTRRSDTLSWMVYGGVPVEELSFEATEDYARRAASKLEGAGGS